MPWVYDDNGDQTWVPDAGTDIYAPPANDGTTADIINLINNPTASMDPSSWLSILSKLGLSTGTAGLAGGAGLAGLLSKAFSGGTADKGYQGGIPNLVASRQMLPIPTTTTTAGGQTVPRRPGSGGVTYFSPMQYTAATPPAGSTATDATIPGSTGVSPPGTTVVPGQEVGPGGYAQGGLAGLGYAKGRLLDGAGDGVSDSIPATIDGSQPAALADGEYIVPARLVSELGNGSTKAGARRLDEMMKRIQQTRKKSIGKNNVAVDSKAYTHLPA